MLIVFHCVGLEVLTVVIMKSTIWDKTPCSPLKNNRRFGVKYHLYLQDRKINRVRNKGESRWQASTFHAGFLLDLLFEPQNGRDMFL
jgi:hypothetical protein